MSDGQHQQWFECWAAGRGGGGRRRGRSSGLTTTEQRVADLVAQATPTPTLPACCSSASKMVVAHLTHVYAKLGVRTCSELIRHLRDTV
ncbi:MAG TPA: helix-turn-helix transcriptional regulator [Kribbella sp.]